MKRTLCLLFMFSAFFQFASAQQNNKALIFTRTSAIDSIVSQKGNLLKLNSGDPKPKVYVNGQIREYNLLTTIPLKDIFKLTYYAHTKIGPYHGLLNNGGALIIVELSSKSNLLRNSQTGTSKEKPLVDVPNVMIIMDDSSPKQPMLQEDNTIYSPKDPGVYVATPPGGMEKFAKYVADNLRYPIEAIEKKIQGTVKISFVVEKDGSFTDIKPENKLGYGLEEEAVKIIKLSRRWNPSIKNGKPVRVRLTYEIKFAL